MRDTYVVARLLLAMSACALATAAMAGETTTYTYDALGRLVTASSIGTVSNGVSATIGYDPAGNRSSYAVTGAGGAPPPPPPPPPPSSVPPPHPTPSNQPPVAEPDRFRAYSCTAATFDALENDHDPDGNSLTITSVYGPAAQAGQMGVSNNMLTWGATSFTGSVEGYYTISDGHGGTATGEFTASVLPGLC